MADGLRTRKPPSNTGADRRAVDKSYKSSAADENNPLTVIDVLRLLAGVVLLSGLLSVWITGDSYTWRYHPWWLRPKAILRRFTPPVVLTEAELRQYDGTDPARPIYLGLNGTIYDETAGRRVYGPGGAYHVFAGVDAARGFITGCFAEDADADLRGAEWTYIAQDVPHPREVRDDALSAAARRRRRRAIAAAQDQVRATLEGWAKVFRGETGKDYFEVGRIARDRDGWAQVPEKTLCAPAESGRPASSTEEGHDAGARFRGG